MSDSLQILRFAQDDSALIKQQLDPLCVDALGSL
jgi:hypothetical protein